MERFVLNAYGVPNLFNFIDENEIDLTNYAVFKGKICVLKSNNDKETSIKKLYSQLEMWDKINYECLVLAIYSKPETTKTPFKYGQDYWNETISFCTTAHLNSKTDNKQIAISGIDPNLYNKLQALEEKINNLDKSISGVDDDEPEDKTMMYLTKANDILNNPFIAGVIGKIFNVNFNQPTALAGIDESEVLQNAINVLMSKGVTLDHIVKLSQLPGDKIKMLLTML